MILQVLIVLFSILCQVQYCLYHLPSYVLNFNVYQDLYGNLLYAICCFIVCQELSTFKLAEKYL